MLGKKPIKVCSRCSGFDVKELDGVVGKKNYTVGCIGACKKDGDKVYGRVDSRVIECSTRDELFSLMKDALK